MEQPLSPFQNGSPDARAFDRWRFRGGNIRDMEERQLVERLNTRDRRTEDDEQDFASHLAESSDNIADGDSECAESNQKPIIFAFCLYIQNTVHN